MEFPNMTTAAISSAESAFFKAELNVWNNFTTAAANLTDDNINNITFPVKMTPGVNQVPSVFIRIFMILYAVLFLGGLANIVVLVLIPSVSGLRTVNNVTIFHISLASLLYSCGLPFLLAIYHYNTWVFGHTVCKIVLVVEAVAKYASMGFIALAALERYIAVCQYKFYMRHCTFRLVWFVAGLAWVLYIFAMTPVIIHSGAFSVYRPSRGVDKTFCAFKSDRRTKVDFLTYTFIFLYVLPAIGTIWSYVSILRKLSASNRKFFGTGNSRRSHNQDYGSLTMVEGGQPNSGSLLSRASSRNKCGAVKLTGKQLSTINNNSGITTADTNATALNGSTTNNTGQSRDKRTRAIISFKQQNKKQTSLDLPIGTNEPTNRRLQATDLGKDWRKMGDEHTAAAPLPTTSTPLRIRQLRQNGERGDGRPSRTDLFGSQPNLSTVVVVTAATNPINPINHNNTTHRQQVSRSATKMVLCLIGCYLVAWTPYWLGNFLAAHQMLPRRFRYYKALLNIFHLLPYISCSLNPLLYVFLTDHFKSVLTTHHEQYRSRRHRSRQQKHLVLQHQNHRQDSFTSLSSSTKQFFARLSSRKKECTSTTLTSTRIPSRAGLSASSHCNPQNSNSDPLVAKNANSSTNIPSNHSNFGLSQLSNDSKFIAPNGQVLTDKCCTEVVHTEWKEDKPSPSAL